MSSFVFDTGGKNFTYNPSKNSNSAGKGLPYFLVRLIFGKDAADKMYETIGSMADKYSGAHMTQGDKEKADYEDAIADENATLAYERQKEFQELYLTPEAQLKSQVAGFDAIGMNRMLLAGSQPGASASTAPQSSGGTAGDTSGSGDIFGALSSIIGVFAQAKDLKESASLKKSQREYQDIVNKWKDKQEEADYNLKLANTELVGANIVKVSEDSKVAAVYAKYAPQLFSSQVALNDANAQKAIADADKAYSDIKLNDAEIRELDARVKKYGKEMDKIDKELLLIEQQCLESASQTYLNDARAQESYQNIKESEERVKKMMKEMGFLDKEIEYYIWNHPRTSGGATFRWNTSSDNGRSRSNIEQYSDEDILAAARARGLIDK